MFSGREGEEVSDTDIDSDRDLRRMRIKVLKLFCKDRDEPVLTFFRDGS